MLILSQSWLIANIPQSWYTKLFKHVHAISFVACFTLLEMDSTQAPEKLSSVAVIDPVMILEMGDSW